MKKRVKVVAAIIENNHGEIFCALRSNDMSLPNLWEFPGGKIELGETYDEALRREILEELDCYIETNLDVFMKTTHHYDTFTVDLVAIEAMIIAKEPKLTEHAQYVWLKKENLLSLNWAPADLPIVHKLMNE